MANNFINEVSLKRDIIDYVEHYASQGSDDYLHISKEQLTSKDYVSNHIDTVVRCLITQYLKVRVVKYIFNADLPLKYAKKVDKIPENAPNWVKKQFKNNNLYYGDKYHLFFPYGKIFDDLHEIFDYLYIIAEQYINRELEKDNVRIRLDYLKTINNISSYENGIEIARKYHEILAEKREIEENKQNLLKDVKVVFNFDDGFKIYELLSRTALYAEGNVMGHCVGASGAYANGIENGSLKIYSLRDEQTMPHVTFEVSSDSMVKQAKGRGNTKPKKYARYCAEFLNKFKLDGKKCLDLVDVVKYNEEKDLYEIEENKVSNQILIDRIQQGRF